MAENENRVLRAAFTAIDPLLLSLLALITVLRTAAIILSAGALAQLTVMMVKADDGGAAPLLFTACGAAVARALLTWAGEVTAAKIAISEKTRYRKKLLAAAVDYGFYDEPQRKDAGASGIDDGQPAPLSYIATFGVEELSKFYTRLLPAVLNAAIVPVTVGMVLLFNDGVSAVIVAVTIPLIPLFMALIGMHTQERVSRTQEALAALGSHMSELIQAIPVVVGLGRAREQARAIKKLSESYRQRSMETLKTAFLSSLALELVSTLSVAAVAVFSGIRLVQGQMELGVGLFVLLIVPECYTPLQNIGSAFHETDVAKNTFARIQQLLGRKEDGKGRVDGRRPKDQEGQEGQLLAWEKFNVLYGDVPLFRQETSAEIVAGQKLSLQGPSGSGKSSLIAALTGTLPSFARTTGSLTNRAEHVIWVAQESGTSQHTIEDELKFYDIENSTDLIVKAGLRPVRNAPLAQLSPGELRRTEIVRALGALDALADRQAGELRRTLIVLDEPTAHLDCGNAEKVRDLIRSRQDRYPEVAWVISTHDQQLALLCDTSIVLPGRKPQAGIRQDQPKDAEPGRSGVGHAAEKTGREKKKKKAPLNMLRAASLALAVLAAASSVSLAALSGWLVIQAGRQTPIFYLMTAVVGVRFFGIARSVLVYWSRLVQHNAIFVLITRLRQELWTALARKGLASRAVLTPGKALAQLVGELRIVEQGLPRAFTPLLIAFLLHATMVAVVALMLPIFIVWQLSVMAVFCVTVVAAWGWMRQVAENSGKISLLCERTMTYMSRIKIITVNGGGRKLQQHLESHYRKITGAQKKYVYGQGMLAAFLEAAFLSVAALMPWILWDWASGQVGRAAVVGALALANIALVQPSVAVIEAVRHALEVGGARRRLKSVAGLRNDGMFLRGTAAGSGSRLPGGPRRKKNFERLELEKASAGWDLTTPVFKELDFAINAGDRIMVKGPSGSGKSTFIAVLLGYLPVRDGLYRMILNGEAVAVSEHEKFSEQWTQARAAFAWCPQQAHIFSSTVRGNLQLASAERFTEKELCRVLDRVRLSELYRRREGLDYFVGPAGSRLSGGERTRLAIARALLTDADVIVLDEPTAHLDALTAREVLSDIRSGLKDKTLVIVSHGADDSAAGDVLLSMPRR